MFCLNNKIHFSLTNANNSASFKRKMVLNHRFCSFTTTNKLVNEAANDSARVSGQDRKKLPALGTNKIAGFRGLRPLASSEKNKYIFIYLYIFFPDLLGLLVIIIRSIERLHDLLEYFLESTLHQGIVLKFIYFFIHLFHTLYLTHTAH